MPERNAPRDRSILGLRLRRVHHGLSLTFVYRWEIMVCWWGFWPCWEVTRSYKGFLRLCIGPARVFLVWPGPVTR